MSMLTGSSTRRRSNPFPPQIRTRTGRDRLRKLKDGDLSRTLRAHCGTPLATVGESAQRSISEGWRSSPPHSGHHRQKSATVSLHCRQCTIYLPTGTSGPSAAAGVVIMLRRVAVTAGQTVREHLGAGRLAARHRCSPVVALVEVATGARRSSSRGRRCAHRAPRRSRPGRLPVSRPLRRVTSPLTIVATYPVAS